MEYTLSFQAEEIWLRTAVYGVNRASWSVERVEDEQKGEEGGNRGEVRVKVVNPDFKDQKRNVEPGSYEGGYTIWESTWILLGFLDEFDDGNGAKALELGAGIGVCGNLLLRKGYQVTFQDLNLKVIEEGLVPNLLLNQDMLKDKNKKNELKVNVKTVFKDEKKSISHIVVDSVKKGDVERRLRQELIAGDWNQLANSEEICKSLDGKFDILIASECIYRVENYKSLLKLVALSLKEGGRGYIATKRFYFGLSGGTFQFLDFLEKFQERTRFKIKGKILRSVEPKNSSNVIDLIELTKEPYPIKASRSANV